MPGGPVPTASLFRQEGRRHRLYGSFSPPCPELAAAGGCWRVSQCVRACITRPPARRATPPRSPAQAVLAREARRIILRWLDAANPAIGGPQALVVLDAER